MREEPPPWPDHSKWYSPFTYLGIVASAIYVVPTAFFLAVIFVFWSFGRGFAFAWEKCK